MSSALDSGALDSDTSLPVLYRRPRIREAATVQDGHTLAEQAVYDAMYRASRPYKGESRILTIGLRTLAELSRMAYSNCKANVRSLIAKLAVDGDTDFSYTSGRTYIIYSFREILRRRKAAGLTHVIRTRGVAFVDPATGRQLSVPNSTALETSALDSYSSALESTESTAPATGQSSASESNALLRNRNSIRKNDEETAAFTAPPLVVAAIKDAMGRVDDAAAAQIALACRQVTPDITDAEVAHFIRQEGPALSRNRGLDNPMGVLIRHIPRCCRGESLRLHRDAERLEHERRQQQAANWLEDARLILTDPNSGQHEREWAQEIIDRYGEGK